MSVHTKKRVPPHRHFRDEVDEARMVRPDRPAYKGVHATDVVIDGTLTLSETAIEWSRLWEEDKFENLDAGVSIVSDATAKNGYALKIPSTTGIVEPFDTPTTFCWGNFG